MKKAIKYSTTVLLAFVMLTFLSFYYSGKAAGIEYLTNTNVFPDPSDGFRIITYDDTRYRTYHIAADGSIYDDASESIAVSAVDYCGTNIVILSLTPYTINVIINNFQSGRKTTVMIPVSDNGSSLVCADREQRVYLTDSSQRELRTYNTRGEMISCADTGSTIKRIFTDGDGREVYAVTDKGLMNINSNRYTGGTVPDGKLIFNGSHCCSSGTIYELDPDRGFTEIFQSGYPMICQTADSIYASDGRIIYRLNESGEKTAHYDTGVNIQQLLASGNSIGYSSGGIFNTFNISNMQPEISNSSPTASLPDYPADISSQELKITSGRISGIRSGTTLAQLKKKINYGDYDITAINHLKKTTSSGTVGSGWELIFSGGGRELRYFTVVTGDVTGEGQVNSRDYDKIAEHITGGEKLDGIRFEAADINSDGQITLSEFYEVYRMEK